MEIPTDRSPGRFIDAHSSRGCRDCGDCPAKRPVPPNGGWGKLGLAGQGPELATPKALPDRQWGVVLHHWGHTQKAAQQPNADVREGMAVEVVDQQAAPSPPLHLAEEPHSPAAVEVVQEEGRVDDIEGVRFVGERKGVSNLDPNLRSEGRGEGGVEVGAGVTHRDRVGVEPDDLGTASKPDGSTNKVDQVVSTPAAQVQNAEGLVASEKRVQDRVRRSVRAQQAVRPPKVSEGSRQTRIRNREIVHPLLRLHPRRKVRQRGE